VLIVNKIRLIEKARTDWQGPGQGQGPNPQGQGRGLETTMRIQVSNWVLKGLGLGARGSGLGARGLASCHGLGLVSVEGSLTSLLTQLTLYLPRQLAVNFTGNESLTKHCALFCLRLVGTCVIATIINWIGASSNYRPHKESRVYFRMSFRGQQNHGRRQKSSEDSTRLLGRPD